VVGEPAFQGRQELVLRLPSVEGRRENLGSRDHLALERLGPETEQTVVTVSLPEDQPIELVWSVD